MRLAYWMILAVVGLLLASCGGNTNGDADPLPTRFVLPTLAPEMTAEPSPTREQMQTAEPTEPAEPTPHPLATETVSPDPLAGDDPVGALTPQPTQPMPDAPESTEPPPVVGVEGDSAVQDFSNLQPGQAVTLAGVIVLDPVNRQVFLQDFEGRRVFLDIGFDQMQQNEVEFITVSGRLEAVEGSSLLALYSPSAGDMLAESTPEIDPQAAFVERQRRELAFVLDEGLSALAVCAALPPLVAGDLDGHELVALWGSPVSGWNLEYHQVETGQTIRYTAAPDGTVQADYIAFLSLDPTTDIYPVDCTAAVLDSEAVYEGLDLTGTPDFLTPELLLYAPEPDALTWVIRSTPPQTIDAVTGQPVQQ